MDSLNGVPLMLLMNTRLFALRPWRPSELSPPLLPVVQPETTQLPCSDALRVILPKVTLTVLPSFT